MWSWLIVLIRLTSFCLFEALCLCCMNCVRLLSETNSPSLFGAVDNSCLHQHWVTTIVLSACFSSISAASLCAQPIPINDEGTVWCLSIRYAFSIPSATEWSRHRLKYSWSNLLEVQAIIKTKLNTGRRSNHKQKYWKHLTPPSYNIFLLLHLRKQYKATESKRKTYYL